MFIGCVYNNKTLKGQKWKKICYVGCNKCFDDCLPVAFVNVLFFTDFGKRIVPLLFCSSLKKNALIRFITRYTILAVSTVKINVNREDSIFLVNNFEIIFHPDAWMN